MATAVTRSYVARRDDDMLYAVDSRRSGEGLTVLAVTQLPSPIRRIGTDDTRIYAATDREVVVLETNAVTGYPHDTIPVLRTTNYRTALPESRTVGAAVGHGPRTAPGVSHFRRDTVSGECRQTAPVTRQMEDHGCRHGRKPRTDHHRR